MPPSSDQSALIAGLRAQLPALQNKTYFNYGGQGPLPNQSLAAILHCWQELQRLGPFSADAEDLAQHHGESLRRVLGRWCGVAPGRLALTENVSSGCVLPLWGLPFEAGDGVLISDAEHPGVVAACRELARRLGLRLGHFCVSDLSSGQAALARLAAALQPRTRLVVLSHLLWNSGVVMPIRAVAAVLAAHPLQPWLMVDGAQSMGSLPLAEAAAAADIYAFTGHKWLCGPEGLGAVVLSERLLEQASPTLIGWRSLAPQEASDTFHRDARRFEVATSCVPLQAGLRQSMGWLAQAGDHQLRLESLQRNSARLWHALQDQQGITTRLPHPPEAGLVGFRLNGLGCQEVVERLGSQGIWIRSLDQPPWLRACCHLFTVPEEVDRLVGALAALAAKR